MSGNKGTVGTLTKPKSKTGQQFLAIMGRSGSTIEAKKDKKAAKERLDAAMAALSPWYDKAKVFGAGKPKTEGALQWPADQYKDFAGRMEKVEAAKKADDYKVAADLAEQARQLAEANDRTKEARKALEAEIQSVSELIRGMKPPPKELELKLASEFEAVRRGEDPGEVLRRVGLIRAEAGGAATSSGEATQAKSPLKEKRIELANSFAEQRRVEEGKVAALASKLPKADGVSPDSVTKLFNKRLSPFLDMLSATKEEGALPDDEARIEHLEDRYGKAIAGLADLSKTFANEMKDGPAFIRTLQDERTKQATTEDVGAARRKFVKDYEPVEQALAQLADMVAPTVPPLQAAVTAAKSRIIDNNQYDKAADAIATMLRHIEAARLQAESAAKTAGGALAAELAELRTTVEKQAKSADPRTKAAYAALTTELGQLDAVASTNNTAAFSAAGERVKAIRAAGVTAAPAVARFNETITAIGAITSDKVVQKEFQSENNDILLAVKTVVGGLSLFELPAAQKTVDGLKRDADKLKSRADSLGPWRKDMEARLKTLEAMIKEFHKLAPKAKDTTFEQNYNEARSQYEKPGVDRAAVSKLVSDAMGLAYPIINNLREAGPSQNRAVEALEADRKKGRAAQEAKDKKQREAEQEKKDLEYNLKLLHADLKTAADVIKVTPHGDAEELNELKELAGQAQKKFDSKPQDLEGASKQFKVVRKRLRALLDTPGGVTAGSVKELAKVETRWNDAMAETRKLLDRISAAARPAAEAARLDPADIKARTDALYERFEPFKATMVRSIKVLADETSDLKIRKAEREYALRDVRSIRAIIDGNAVAAKLSANPFDLAPPFAKLRRFLNDMEYNALRAVPPE